MHSSETTVKLERSSALPRAQQPVVTTDPVRYKKTEEKTPHRSGETRKPPDVVQKFVENEQQEQACGRSALSTRQQGSTQHLENQENLLM